MAGRGCSGVGAGMDGRMQTDGVGVEREAQLFPALGSQDKTSDHRPQVHGAPHSAHADHAVCPHLCWEGHPWCGNHLDPPTFRSAEQRFATCPPLSGFFYQWVKILTSLLIPRWNP